jgi:hypothetical protein
MLLSQSRKGRQEMFCKRAVFQDILVKDFASLAALREISKEIIDNEL